MKLNRIIIAAISFILSMTVVVAVLLYVNGENPILELTQDNHISIEIKSASVHYHNTKPLPLKSMIVKRKQKARGIDKSHPNPMMWMKKKTKNKVRAQRVHHDTKLTIFLHFHKAGGTSITHSVDKKENLFDPNGNGNPKQLQKLRGGKSPVIPYWTFNEQLLTLWFNKTLNMNLATFIAAENHWFENTSIIDEEYKRQNRLELVTQIRNPFKRFLSNFFFDARTGSYVESKRVKKLPFIDRLRRYHSCPHRDPPKRKANCTVWTKFNATNDWNMFVRVLSTQFQFHQELSEEALNVAMKELDKFDFVTVLDIPGSKELWEKKYGIEMHHKMNTNASEYATTYDRERERNPNFDDEFKEFEKEFERLNRFDYVLYERAVEMHRESLLKYNVSIPLTNVQE